MSLALVHSRARVGITAPARTTPEWLHRSIACGCTIGRKTYYVESQVLVRRMMPALSMSMTPTASMDTLIDASLPYLQTLAECPH